MNEDLMKHHEKITPTSKYLLWHEVIFPEAIFLAAAVPEMYLFSCGKYGKKGKQREPKLPGYLYGDYLRIRQILTSSVPVCGRRWGRSLAMINWKRF